MSSSGEKHKILKKKPSRVPEIFQPFRAFSGKFRVFFQGFKTAFQTDKSFAFIVISSLIVLSIAFALKAWLDVLIILIVTGVLLTTELLNTALENLCDVVQPEFDERIGQIKDVASAATGIMLVVWVGTLIIEVFRIWP